MIRPNQHGSQEKAMSDEVKKVNSTAPMSTEQMMKMLLETQAQLAESQQHLAEAIMESRKPYVDPKVLAQKQKDLEDRRKQIQMEQEERILRKKICPHQRENGTYNIKWMAHSNGITKGVCGTCFSEFDTRNPSDLELLRHDLKSIRNMGRAGQHAVRGNLIQS
jgi:hypothetical protein